MKMIFVSGLKDVDKDTIVDLAIKNSGKLGKTSHVDMAGSLDEDLLKAGSSVIARQIARSFYEDMEKKMIQKLKGREEDVMVSGYLTVKHPGLGFLACLPDDFFRVFRPDAIVLLEKDGLEDDDREHQRLNRNYAANYALMSGASLKIIKMSKDNMMNAVRELGNMIRS